MVRRPGKGKGKGKRRIASPVTHVKVGKKFSKENDSIHIEALQLRDPYKHKPRKSNGRATKILTEEKQRQEYFQTAIKYMAEVDAIQKDTYAVTARMGNLTAVEGLEEQALIILNAAIHGRVRDGFLSILAYYQAALSCFVLADAPLQAFDVNKKIISLIKNNPENGKELVPTLRALFRYLAVLTIQRNEDIAWQCFERVKDIINDIKENENNWALLLVVIDEIINEFNQRCSPHLIILEKMKNQALKNITDEVRSMVDNLRGIKHQIKSLATGIASSPDDAFYKLGVADRYLNETLSAEEPFKNLRAITYFLFDTVEDEVDESEVVKQITSSEEAIADSSTSVASSSSSEESLLMASSSASSPERFLHDKADFVDYLMIIAKLKPLNMAIDVLIFLFPELFGDFVNALAKCSEHTISLQIKALADVNARPDVAKIDLRFLINILERYDVYPHAHDAIEKKRRQAIREQVIIVIDRLQLLDCKPDEQMKRLINFEEEFDGLVLEFNKEYGLCTKENKVTEKYIVLMIRLQNLEAKLLLLKKQKSEGFTHIFQTKINQILGDLCDVFSEHYENSALFYENLAAIYEKKALEDKDVEQKIALSKLSEQSKQQCAKDSLASERCKENRVIFYANACEYYKFLMLKALHVALRDGDASDYKSAYQYALKRFELIGKVRTQSDVVSTTILEQRLDAAVCLLRVLDNYKGGTPLPEKVTQLKATALDATIEIFASSKQTGNYSRFLQFFATSEADFICLINILSDSGVMVLINANKFEELIEDLVLSGPKLCSVYFERQLIKESINTTPIVKLHLKKQTKLMAKTFNRRINNMLIEWNEQQGSTLSRMITSSLLDYIDKVSKRFYLKGETPKEVLGYPGVVSRLCKTSRRICGLLSEINQEYAILRKRLEELAELAEEHLKDLEQVIKEGDIVSVAASSSTSSKPGNPRSSDESESALDASASYIPPTPN